MTSPPPLFQEFLKPDNFGINFDDPHYAIHKRISDVLLEYDASHHLRVMDDAKFQHLAQNDLKSVPALLGDPAFKPDDIILCLLIRQDWMLRKLRYRRTPTRLIRYYLASKPPLTPIGLKKILEAGIRVQSGLDSRLDEAVPYLRLLEYAEDLSQDVLNETGILDLIRMIIPSFTDSKYTAEIRAVERVVDGIISKALGSALVVRLSDKDPWSARLLADISANDRESISAWTALLRHCDSLTGAKPSEKWMKTASKLLDAVGLDDFYAKLEACLPLTAEPRDQLLQASDMDFLKGLLFIAARHPRTSVLRLIGDLMIHAYKPVREVGPRSQKIGNASVFALTSVPGTEAAGQLVRARQRIRNLTGRKLIEKGIAEAAAREGISPDDLEELAVPDFGFTGEGVLRQTFGDYTAEARIVGTAEIDLVWFNADGKAQASIPQRVKDTHPAELKAFKKSLDDAKKFLPAQRDRIDSMMMRDRVWRYQDWRQFYVDHPLLAHMTRRLIWEFRDEDTFASGIFHAEEIENQSGEPIRWLQPRTEVRLWHPLGRPIGEVLAWRRRLEETGLCQPFKQAHREIYILTDAEVRTETYSNRFAGHILGQHQMAALCKQRGWRYNLAGMWDGGDSVPTLALPESGLIAHFFVEPVNDPHRAANSGVLLFVSTDQVRFTDNAGVAVPLATVPPRVFSEVMRQVDLFVGVASVGNDPNWRDRGDNLHGDYWQSYAFGELTASAATRRDVLERLLPKLKIASCCELSERYLIVRGKLRTYHIHLGSSNIQMEPNNQYLCIVADHVKAARDKGSGKVFLPFEGDTTLATILSKAFLLAADDKITDPTITRQINMK